RPEVSRDRSRPIWISCAGSIDNHVPIDNDFVSSARLQLPDLDFEFLFAASNRHLGFALRLRLDRCWKQRDFTAICGDRIEALQGTQRVNTSSSKFAGKYRIGAVNVYRGVLDDIARAPLRIVFKQQGSF